jgi:hypothetical protein
MKLISDIIALTGWNTSMLMLLAKATFILIAALGITVAMQRAISSGSLLSARFFWCRRLRRLLRCVSRFCLRARRSRVHKLQIRSTYSRRRFVVFLNHRRVPLWLRQLRQPRFPLRL